MEIKLLKLSSEDISAVSGIYYAEFSKKHPEWTRRTAKLRVLQAFNNHPALCYKIIFGHELVGFVLAERLDFALGKYAYLADTALSSKFQGKGIGAQAIKKALKIFKKNGYKRVFLHAEGDKKTLEFYYKLGFRKSGYVHLELPLKQTSRR